VRAVGDSVQMTLCPAEMAQGPGLWTLRLRGGSEDVERLAAGLEAGEMAVWPASDTEALAYLPNFPYDGAGTIGRAPVPEDGEELTFHRRMVLPLELCAEVGQNLRLVVAALDPPASHDGWEPESCTECQGCGRPVFDSMDTAMVMGGPFPVTIACALCFSGHTLKSVREAGMTIPPQQRAVLESIDAM
jgi:hypothetical protein